MSLFLKSKMNDRQKTVIDKIETSEFFVNIFKLMYCEKPVENADDFRIHTTTAPSIFSLNNQFTVEYRNNGKVELIDFSVGKNGEIETLPKHAEQLQHLFSRYGLNDLDQPSQSRNFSHKPA